MTRKDKRRIEREQKKYLKRSGSSWVTDRELEQIINQRDRDTINQKGLLSKLFSVTHTDLLLLDGFSSDLGLNRGFTKDCREIIQNLGGMWSIEPVMFHDFKRGNLTERHLRCMVKPTFETKSVSLLFLDIPLNFQNDLIYFKRNKRLEELLN